MRKTLLAPLTSYSMDTLREGNDPESNIDKINKPYRPIPSNVIAKDEARTIAWILYLVLLYRAVWMNRTFGFLSASPTEAKLSHSVIAPRVAVTIGFRRRVVMVVSLHFSERRFPDGPYRHFVGSCRFRSHVGRSPARADVVANFHERSARQFQGRQTGFYIAACYAATISLAAAAILGASTFM